MESSAAVLEIGLVLLAAAAAGWVARRLTLPAVIGYLVVGIAVSPFTPGYVADRHQLQLLADIGVVLLLFEVGIEVDLRRLWTEHGRIAWAAPLQVAITMGLTAAVTMAMGLATWPALVLGLAIALSSSVVIVNITRSRHRTTSPATEAALLGWSVVQDVTGVVVASVLLAVGGGSELSAPEAVIAFAAFTGVAAVVALVLPRVLATVRDQADLFLLVSVSAGLALAGAGAVVFHVPMALAAFIGGLAITGSQVADEARQRLLPFRDLFAVLFFVAIGTLLDPSAVAKGAGWLVALLALIGVSKVGVVWVIARVAHIGDRPLQLAAGLGQVGEFSFVFGAGLAATGAISTELYVALVAAVAISIAVSTVLVRPLWQRPIPA